MGDALGLVRSRPQSDGQRRKAAGSLGREGVCGLTRSEFLGVAHERVEDSERFRGIRRREVGQSEGVEPGRRVREVRAHLEAVEVTDH